MNGFAYDDETHTYSLNGRKMDSVTQILEHVGILDKKWFKEFSWVRGKQLHAALHYLDDGDLDWDSVLPEHMPYIEGYTDFRSRNLWAWTDLEEPIYHKFLLYGGTPDRVSDAVLLDIKTGVPMKWHALQLTAYQMALMSHGHLRRQLFDLYLSDKGKYTLVPVKDDRKTWLSALRVHRFAA